MDFIVFIAFVLFLMFSALVRTSSLLPAKVKIINNLYGAFCFSLVRQRHDAQSITAEEKRFCDENKLLSMGSAY